MYVNEFESYTISDEALADPTFRDDLIALGLDPRTGSGQGTRSAIALDGGRNTTNNLLDARRGYVLSVAPGAGGPVARGHLGLLRADHRRPVFSSVRQRRRGGAGTGRIRLTRSAIRKRAFRSSSGTSSEGRRTCAAGAGSRSRRSAARGCRSAARPSSIFPPSCARRCGANSARYCSSTAATCGRTRGTSGRTTCATTRARAALPDADWPDPGGHRIPAEPHSRPVDQRRTGRAALPFSLQHRTGVLTRSAADSESLRRRRQAATVNDR